MLYKLIIFDWDGTLMDSEAKIVSCLRSTISYLNFEFREDDQLKNVIGLGLTEAILSLYPEFKQQQIQLFINEYQDQFLEKDNIPSTLFEGVIEMLNNLKQKGLLLAVATGKGRQGLNQVFEKYNLTNMFDSSRCADETLSKPEPLMLKEILKELNVSTQRALMIGDTAYDLEMANNIGMNSVAITHGVHSLERLLAHKPITNVSCIEELNQWLNNLFNTNLR